MTKAGTGYTGTIRYVYAEDGKLLGEYDNTGTIIAEHVYLNDTPVAVLKAAGAYLVQADHLNTPRAILGAANAVVWKWDSDAFGTTAANENPSALGAFNYNLRFPGQYYDKETTNHYNYFRDNYNPKIGRYMQSDPIGLAGGINTFGYVGSDPVYWKDPSGLERKPGKTPPGRWPKPPEDVCGKKPKWNPDGYWDGKKGRRLTWDDRSHGTGQDRGDGPQGGHWDDETSDNRWDQNGRSLPGSPEAKSNFTALDWALGAGAGAAVGVGLVLIPEITVPVLVIGGAVAK